MQNDLNNDFNDIGSKFITLPGEKLILAQRKHWYSFIFPLVLVLILSVASIIGLIVLSSFFTSYIDLILSSIFFITIATATFIGKSIVDWYFNFYIITTRKIIEVSYRPLSSRHTNEILLDQVKCTEIDTKVDGIIHELLDLGDIVITFDRPTHQEEFVLSDMRDPRKIEAKLENALCPTQDKEIEGPNEARKASWFNKEKQNPTKWRYIEEIRPVGIN